MSPDQCRQARALLGWNRRRLASAAGLSEQTIRRLEAGGIPRPTTILAVRRTFEAAGLDLSSMNAKHGFVRLSSDARAAPPAE